MFNNHDVAKNHILGHKMFIDDNVINHNINQIKIDDTVDVNSNKIDNINHVQFDVLGEVDEPIHSEGVMFYCDENKSFTYYVDEDSVSMNVGYELWDRAKNDTGSTVYNGSVIYPSGSTGDNIEFKLAQANDLSTLRAIAVVNQDSIRNNAVGYVTTYGRVRGIDTSVDCDGNSLTAGDSLYVCPTHPGGFTKTKPSYPNFAYRIGWVVRAHSSNGCIFVDSDKEIDIFTTNSVLFANGNGELSEDNTNLYFNNSTDTFYAKNITFDTLSADCSDIDILQLDSPTWTNQCDFNNLFGSVGRATGGSITDNGDGTVSVSAGTGFIKATDSDTADLLSFDWSGSSNISVPTDTVKYFGVEYNSGSPQVVSKDTNSWDYDTEFPLGSVINRSDVLYILNNPWWVTDGLTNVIERLQSFGYTVRDDYVGGLILGVTGTRNPTITAGTVWSRLNEFEIDSIDCSGTDTFHSFYRDGSGGWTETTGLTQYPVSQYDDGSGTLQNLTNNRYANWWVFLEVDTHEATNGKLMFIYPQNQYSNVADAESESVPTFPTSWYEHGLLVGRITFQEGTDAPVEVSSTFDTQFTSTAVNTHNNLAGLQGGDADEYYHLNLTDYNSLTDANAQLSSLHTDGSPTFNAVTVTSITDGVNSNTEWNDAYSKRVDTWGNGLEFSSNTASVDYNTTNLKITSSELNTIQDISTTSSPTFNDLTLTTLTVPTINGNTTFSNNITITGDLTVNGTTTTINTETVQVEDNIMVVNYGETGSGVTAGTAGIEVDRGTSTNYQFLFRESDDCFAIGEVGSLQAVATREDSPTDNGLGFWDSSTSKFETSSDLVFDGSVLSLGVNLDMSTFDITNCDLISSVGNIVMDIDSDNDSTTRQFIVRKDGSTELFSVNESGEVDILTGNLDMNDNSIDNIGYVDVNSLTNGDTTGGILFDTTLKFHDFNYGNNGTVTTEGYNLFIGENSGNFTLGSTATSAITASYNIGLGYYTLNSLTTGYNNAVVGTYSGQNLTTGRNNACIGHNSLNSANTGYFNSAIGSNSLYNLTSGFRNTGVGFQSGYGNTTGNYNTCVGADSLSSNQDGDNNVAIGYNAGSDYGGYLSNTSPDNCVFIGVNTEADSNTDTNEIVIGYNAVGQGSNTVIIGNDDITDTYLKGNVDVESDLTVDTDTLYVDSTNNRVGIGTTSPTKILDVDGDLRVRGNDISDSGDNTVLSFDGSGGIDNSVWFSHSSTPFRFFERGTSNYARFVFDANSFRFDFDDDGDGDFNPYTTPISMASDGDVSIGGNVYMNNSTLCIDVNGSAGIEIRDSDDSDNYRVRMGDSSGNGGFITLYDESESSNLILRGYEYGAEDHTIKTSGSIEITGNDRSIDFTGTSGPYGFTADNYDHFFIFRTSPQQWLMENSAGTDIFSFDIDGQGDLYVNDDALINDDFNVNGTKNFIIDHPVDPLNKDLKYSSVEGPYIDLIHRGQSKLTNGKVVVNIDSYYGLTNGTFENLTQNVQVTSLQSVDSFVRVKSSGVVNGEFTIIAEDDDFNGFVNWVVIGERADPAVKHSKSTDSDGHLINEIDKRDLTVDEVNGDKRYRTNMGIKGFYRKAKAFGVEQDDVKNITFSKKQIKRQKELGIFEKCKSKTKEYVKSKLNK